MDSRNYEELLPGHSANPISDVAWTDESCDLNDTVRNPFSTPPYVSPCCYTVYPNIVCELFDIFHITVAAWYWRTVCISGTCVWI